MKQRTDWAQPAHSMYGVVGRMQLLQDYFFRNKQYRGLIPFLHTYYVVTKTVAGKSYFNNPAKLEALDIQFADMYFKPLAKFLHKDTEPPSPWKTYFEYCTQAKGNAFLEMLLGINAHINADLVVCLFSLQYNERKDYLRINRILSDVTPNVMTFLAKEYQDLFAFGGIMFPHFTHQEFTRIIVRWRKQAWINAERMRQQSKPVAIQLLHSQTEGVARQLIDIFSGPASALSHKDQLERLRVVL